MWGWPEPSKGKQLADGEMIRTENFNFQVIYTPGHSPDHICLYEPERGWLFSGDLFIGGRDRALSADFDIWGVIQSLKKITDLPLSKLFPGSAHVRENPGRRIAGENCLSGRNGRARFGFAQPRPGRGCYRQNLIRQSDVHRSLYTGPFFAQEPGAILFAECCVNIRTIASCINR